MITAPDTAIADLRPHPRNYQRHPPDQLDEIARSITEHGYFRNIVVARGGVILAGHGVVEAAARLGHTTVPVLQLDIDPDSPEALKVLVADNEISRLAVVDDRALTEMLRDILESAETALEGTGFTAEQLAALALATRPSSELADWSAALEWVGLPEFAGDGQAALRLIVNFDSVEDRERLVAEYQLTIDVKRDALGQWSTRWPWRPRDDRASIEYQ